MCATRPADDVVRELVGELDRSYCCCSSGNCTVCRLRRAFGFPADTRYKILGELGENERPEKASRTEGS